MTFAGARWHRSSGLAALAAAAYIVLALGAPARAEAQGGVRGLLSQLDYGVEGGVMVPSGPQGHTLAHGPYFGAFAYGESSLGLLLGVDASYAASNDVRQTRIGMLDVFGRLSPIPDDYRAYLQMSVGAYVVGYHPPAGIVAPGTRVRPGGSFALGLDPIQFGNLKLGGLVAYHGVILNRGSALSYVTATLNLTLAPSPY